MEDRMQIHPAVSAAVLNSTNKQPPAQAARAAVSGQPDLADQPFGKLVSDFARGIPLPAPASSVSITI
jgi:hypothetical protein